MTLVIYGLNVSFKMQFLSFSWKKNPKFFPSYFFVLVFLVNIEFQENSSAQISSWLRACTLMAYLRIALHKNRVIDSLVEHYTKIMKMLEMSRFSVS